MKKNNYIIIGLVIIVTIITTISVTILLSQTEKNESLISNDTPANYISTANFQDRQQTNQNINSSRENAITATVKNISPSVVGINVTEVREYRDPFSSFFDDPFFKNDPFFRRFFGDRSYKQEVQSLGSGFIISKDGYIVTNDHVAGNAKKVVATLTNGEKYDAEVIGSDPTSDICLLKIEGKNFPFVKFGNSDEIIIGEWVIALGNPFGLFNVNNKPTVTVGVVSSTGLTLQPINNRYYRKMIQTDAPINGGNSGGPLVNSVSEVIGMNTIIYTGNSYSAGNIGIGFAIPINKIKSIVDELKHNKKIERDFWTGLSIQTLDSRIAKYYGLKSTKGVVITQIERNSPASDAKLEVGDVILEIDGEQVTDENDVRSAFFEFRTGQSVKLKILHNDKIIDRTMKLEKR
ncbi:MAG: trypsin-like serine protease [Ignavibacteria bacterium]|nr:trypsin-like serine protease [Ignavibacteria bacterium]